MKNKKIIFLVATICCLVVAFACFSGFTADSTYYNFYVQVDSSLEVVDFAQSDWDINFIIQENSTFPPSSSNSSKYQTVYYHWALAPIVYDNSTLLYRLPKSLSTWQNVYCILTTSNAELGYWVFSQIDIYSSSNVVYDGYDSRKFSNLYVANLSLNGNITSNNAYTVATLSRVLSGGVSQEQYDELLADYEASQQQNLEWQQGYVQLRGEYNDLQQSYDRVSQQLAQAEENYSQLQHDFDQLQIAYDVKNSALEEARTENATLEREVEYLIGVVDSLQSGNTALNFIGTAFEKVGDILQIEILPNITIGTIVAIPLILGVVFLVLRLVRGE